MTAFKFEVDSRMNEKSPGPDMEGLWRIPGDRDWRVVSGPFGPSPANAERAALLAMVQHINKMILHAAPHVINVRYVSGDAENYCGYKVDRPNWDGGAVVELAALLRPATGDPDLDSPLDIALLDLTRALDFYDRVKASTEDEKIAVGQDHYNWIFRAVRRLAPYGGARTFRGPSQRERIQTAFDMLSSFLLENTENVFEELPNVDTARSLLSTVLEENEIADAPKYALHEVIGTIGEYLAMPCDSLRERMAASTRRYGKEAKAPPPHVRRFLDCSTGHVTAATGKWLDSTPQEEWHISGAKLSYGWLVHVPDDAQDADRAPKDLLLVMAHARSLGCHYVMFDRDGDRIDGLPFFEW